MGHCKVHIIPKNGSSFGDEDPADPCWLLDVILHDTDGSSIGIGFEELAAGDFPYPNFSIILDRSDCFVGVVEPISGTKE